MAGATPKTPSTTLKAKKPAIAARHARSIDTMRDADSRGDPVTSALDQRDGAGP